MIIQISYSFFPFGSESSMEPSLSGTKVPGIFRSQERKFHGTFVPGSECSIETIGAKVPGSESSCYHIRSFTVRIFKCYQCPQNYTISLNTNLGDIVEFIRVLSRTAMSGMLSHVGATRTDHLSSAPHNLRLTTCGFFNRTITALINCSVVHLTDST